MLQQQRSRPNLNLRQAAPHRPTGSGNGKRHPAAQPSRVGTALKAGASGFVIGIVFWHFVGFWDFVSNAVFRPEPRNNQTEAATARDNTATLVPILDQCISLTRDPLSGTTLSAPCTGEAAAFEFANSERSDKLVSPNARAQTAQAN